MARKKITIDASVCIGCGCCAATYPDDIKLNDAGLAEPINGEAEEEVKDICAVSAITVID